MEQDRNVVTLRAEARAAGLSRAANPSLADVDQRRSQLWGVAFLALVALAASVALTAQSADIDGVQRLPAFRIGIVLLMLGLGAYVVEKETHLRRITHLLLEEHAAHVMLAEQVVSDPLTGLLNRNAFRARLDQAVERARAEQTSLAVLFLDLDRFKAVNDTLGHQAGDALLVQAAERLRTVVRGDDALSRYGGDEFTVLLEGLTGPEHAVSVAERVQAALAEPFPIGPEGASVGVSVGITISLNGEDDADTLLREADIAMYLAKRAGRSRFEIFED